MRARSPTYLVAAEVFHVQSSWRFNMRVGEQGNEGRSQKRNFGRSSPRCRRISLAPIDAPRPGSAAPLPSPSHCTSGASFVTEARCISPMGSIPFTAHSRITTWRCCGLKITFFLACWMERASSWRQSPTKNKRRVWRKRKINLYDHVCLHGRVFFWGGVENIRRRDGLRTKAGRELGKYVYAVCLREKQNQCSLFTWE